MLAARPNASAWGCSSSSSNSSSSRKWSSQKDLAKLTWRGGGLEDETWGHARCCYA